MVVTQRALILICQHQSHWIFVFIGRYYIGTKLGSLWGLGISGFLWPFNICSWPAKYYIIPVCILSISGYLPIFLHFGHYYLILLNGLSFGKKKFKNCTIDKFIRVSALHNGSFFQSIYLSEVEKNTGLQIIFFFLRWYSLCFSKKNMRGLLLHKQTRERRRSSWLSSVLSLSGV